VTHLRKMMLEELQRRNYAQNPAAQIPSEHQQSADDDPTPYHASAHRTWDGFRATSDKDEQEHAAEKSANHTVKLPTIRQSIVICHRVAHLTNESKLLMRHAVHPSHE
jgi:hypothetical protein